MSDLTPFPRSIPPNPKRTKVISQFLRVSLLFPLRKNAACCIALLSGLEYLEQTKSQSQELYRDMMRFLCHDHTLDTEALENRMRVCHCNLDEEAIHSLHPPRTFPGQSFTSRDCEAAIGYLVASLADKLEELKRYRKVNPTSKYTPWPTNLADLCSGADAVTTFKRLRHWLKPPKSVSILPFIGQLGEFSRDFNKLVLSSRDLWLDVIRFLEAAISAPTEIEQLNILLGIQMLLRVCTWDGQGLDIVVRLHLVDPDYNPHWRSVGERVLPVIRKVAHGGRHRVSNKPLTLQTEMFTALFRLPALTAKMGELTLFMPQITTEITLDRLFDYLAAQRKSGDKCSNLACVTPEESVRHTRLCEACGVMRFCTMECFRASWKGKDPHKGHKVICNLICQIQDIFGVKAAGLTEMLTYNDTPERLVKRDRFVEIAERNLVGEEYVFGVLLNLLYERLLMTHSPTSDPNTNTLESALAVQRRMEGLHL